MSIRDLEGLQRTLKAMEDAEVAASRMYAQCALLWPAEKEFWEALEQDEVNHAQQIAKISALVAQNPHEFDAGHPFNEVAMRSIVKYTDDVTAELKSNALPRTRFLFVARDIENSLLEAKYMDVVKTRNVEKLAFLEQVHKDTARHKGRLEAKIRESK